METILHILMIATLTACLIYNIYNIYESHTFYKKMTKDHEEFVNKLINKKISNSRTVRKDFKYEDSNGTRDLAGRTFTIDREITANDIYERLTEWNPACVNFCYRRRDFNLDFDKKLYYGHIVDENGYDLGYIMCEDELEEEI